MQNLAKYLFITLLFVVSTLYAQSEKGFKRKIVDGQNNIPLENVLIVNTDTNESVYSNELGEFYLSKSGTYKFVLLGYKEKNALLSDSTSPIIQLYVNPSELNEVTVSANHIPQKLKKSVATINLITSKEIERNNNYNFTQVLNQVPGVYMQSGALNTNKITIRGIGSRNLYGTSKIRAYFQDIPLTSGNGETTIEDFELGSIARLEIIKGGNSNIYGSGLGGTVHLSPIVGALNKSSSSGEFSVGSFELTKGILTANHGGNNHNFQLIYSDTHSDGYRENNEYDRQTVTFNSTHFFGEKDYLTFLGSYVDLKAFIPSSINEEAFKNNPTSAAYTWGKAQGYEDSKRGIFGISWNHDYKNELKQITSIFTNFRDSYEPRPFNILEDELTAIGIRSRILGVSELFNNPLKWTAGGELFSDQYRSKTFENLYADYPLGTGSVQGNLLSNFKEKRSYYNLFIDSNYEITDKTMLSLGLNLNQTSYKLYDQFEKEEYLDQSGSHNFGIILSPKIGVAHLLSDNTTIYANASHGFSPPTLEETLLPDGKINTAIEPETGWNFEIGTRGSWFHDRLTFNLALFRLDIENLLVAKRTSEDQFVGVNAGKTEHNGLELVLNYKLIQTNNLTLNSFTTYTLNNFTFKEFIDNGNNYSGNKLTGVPSNVLTVGLEADTKFGLYGNLNFQYVDTIPMRDDNSIFSEAYTLTNLKLGYKFSLNKHFNFNSFIGINNIFDKAYASQILINASSFGGNAPRYYYPGNPTNYYTGIRVNYLF